MKINRRPVLSVLCHSRHFFRERRVRIARAYTQFDVQSNTGKSPLSFFPFFSNSLSLSLILGSFSFSRCFVPFYFFFFSPPSPIRSLDIFNFRELLQRSRPDEFSDVERSNFKNTKSRIAAYTQFHLFAIINYVNLVIRQFYRALRSVRDCRRLER